MASVLQSGVACRNCDRYFIAQEMFAHISLAWLTFRFAALPVAHLLLRNVHSFQDSFTYQRKDSQAKRKRSKRYYVLHIKYPEKYTSGILHTQTELLWAEMQCLVNCSRDTQNCPERFHLSSGISFGFSWKWMVLYRRNLEMCFKFHIVNVPRPTPSFN